jgi:hypothetical protein
MAGSADNVYEVHRSRARSAITRQEKAADADRKARADRDAEVLAMLATPGASLGKVATDVGLSKSMVAYIQRTSAAAITNADQALAYLEAHPGE